MADKKAPATTLSDREREIVRRHIRDLVNQHGRQRDVARLLGIGQPTVSALLHNQMQPGLRLAQIVAAERGMSTEELLERDLRTAVPDALPERAAAIAAGRRIGVSEKAIARLKTYGGPPQTSAIRWMWKLLHIQCDMDAAIEPIPHPASRPHDVQSRP